MSLSLPLPLSLPESRAHIAQIQSERKKEAFALAKTVPWYRERLAGIDGDALDDPAEWQKIPILDKDTLRGLSDDQFYNEFCHKDHDGVSELWRSGGVTGKPVAGYSVELRGEAGVVPDGEIGDLWVSGRSAALFYWNAREKTQSTFHGPWLKTGDKYSRADGYYTYAGRNDDMLKISGQFVSPFEVESILQEHASVLEAAVIALTDPRGLTQCKAFVVLREGVKPAEQLVTELQGFVKQRLAPHKRPHFIEFLTELPKTATGKIQRFKLRDSAAQ